jgi:hypothetical protein
MPDDRESLHGDEQVEEKMEGLRKRIEERVREIDAPWLCFMERIRRLLKKR